MKKLQNFFSIELKNAEIFDKFIMIVLYLHASNSILSSLLIILSYFFMAEFRILHDPMARILETKGKNKMRTDNK